MNKISKERGITLISLVITIIVLLILAGVAITMLSGENGILKKSAKASFASDIGKYKEELELSKYNIEIDNKTNKNSSPIKTNEITEWNLSEIKRYISSFDKKYEGKIGIVNGKLAFKGDGEELNWAQDLGLEIKSEKATITIETQGLGDVVPLGNVKIKEGKIETQVDKEIELSATPGKVEDVESTFVGWYINGTELSKLSNYKYKVTGDATLTAVFEMDATIIYYLDENNEEKVKIDKSTTLSGYAGDSTITKVEVGKSCRSIGLEAFKGCENLKEVIADTTNTLTLGNSAFHSCANLTDARFYNVKLDKIGSRGYQFYNCTNLAYLQLGKPGLGVSDITAEASIHGSTNDKLVVKVYLSDSTKRLDCWDPEATIYYYDESEKMINAIWGAYYSGDTNIESVEIPDETTVIKARAFKDCTNLKLTKLPANLNKIEESAFENCTSLGELEIPSTCTSIGTSAFKNSGLTTIIADTTNTLTLGNSAFHSCANLTDARFYNVKLDKIGSRGYQFYNCTNLAYLQLGKPGLGVSDITAEASIYGSTIDNLIVKVYLSDSTKRLDCWDPEATIYYYDEDENLIEKVPSGE